MALTNGFQLPFGIQPLNPVPTDAWSGPYEGVTENAAIAAANSSIPAGVRFKSLEVRLIINGKPKKYWYQNGVADSDLVEYLSELTNYINTNFLQLSGGTINGNLAVLSSFKVSNNNTVLLVSGGKIGVNTELPNTELTVIGSISANNVIYSSLGNSNQWDSVFTTVQTNSAQWATDNSVDTEVRALTANWQDTFTNVQANSASYATYNYVNANFLPLTGGIVNGNLTVNQNISTSNVFVNNNLTVTNTVSANYFKGTIIDWMTLTRGFKTEPTLNTTIAGGDIYNYVYESSPTDKTYYRYIATDGSEDAYYETFSGGILSNLITKKKIIV